MFLDSTKIVVNFSDEKSVTESGIRILLCHKNNAEIENGVLTLKNFSHIEIINPLLKAWKRYRVTLNKLVGNGEIMQGSHGLVDFSHLRETDYTQEIQLLPEDNSEFCSIMLSVKGSLKTSFSGYEIEELSD